MGNDVSGAVILQNVITGNSSFADAGIYWVSPPAVLMNNTLTDGPASTGTSTSIVYANGMYNPVVVANNVIVASYVATDAFYCGITDIWYPQNFYNNDIMSTNGAAYGGMCTAQIGANGNISAIPRFLTASNLRLKGGSPAIDAGSNSAPNLPNTDFAGSPPIINGSGVPTAIVDMGAYEFVPAVLSPTSLKFGLQAVGSSTSKSVTLANKQNRTLNIASTTAPAGYSVSGCGASLAAFKNCTLTVTFNPQTAGTFNGALIIADDAGNSPQTVTLSGSAQ